MPSGYAEEDNNNSSPLTPSDGPLSIECSNGDDLDSPNDRPSKQSGRITGSVSTLNDRRSGANLSLLLAEDLVVEDTSRESQEDVVSSPNSKPYQNPVRGHDVSDPIYVEEESVHFDSTLKGSFVVEDEFGADPNLQDPPESRVREVLDDGMSDVDDRRFMNGDSKFHFGSETEIDSEADEIDHGSNYGNPFKREESGKIKIMVDQVFIDANQFREVMLQYSVQEGFKLERIKNESTRVTLGCKAEGCKWRVHASRTESRVSFRIKTLNDEHSCIQVNSNRDVTSSFLGKEYGDIIRANKNISVDNLKEMIVQKYALEVPNHTLYRAKQYALNQGKEEYTNSFNKLHSYGYVIRSRDPSSSVYVITIRFNPNINSLAHFYRFFLSFQAQKLGYLTGCRPFIYIDGTHIKAQFEGTLLLAVTIVANNGIYPVAFGIVNKENFDNWSWFLELLWEHMGVAEKRTVTFMSDWCKGLDTALENCWPRHRVRHCAKHILDNVMHHYKVDCLKEHFWAAAKQPNKVLFFGENGSDQKAK